MCAVQSLGADKLLEEVQGHVVHDGHVVGVPTYRTAHMEHQLRNIKEQGRNLVRHILGRLVVTCVEGVYHFAGSAVALKEVH